MGLMTARHPLAGQVWKTEESAFVAGERWVPLRGAKAIVHRQLPEVWDASFVSRVSATADPRVLLDESRRHLARQGCSHVKILIDDPTCFNGVGLGLSRRGLLHRTYLTMCVRSLPEPPGPKAAVRVMPVRNDRDRATMASIRTEVRREAPWYSPEVNVALDTWENIQRDTLDLIWMIAFLEDRPAGAAGLLVTDHGASLQSLATVPSLRRRGVGAALVREIVRRGLARSAPFVCLLTDEFSGPVSFYKRLGFREVGRVQEYLQAMC